MKCWLPCTAVTANYFSEGNYRVLFRTPLPLFKTHSWPRVWQILCYADTVANFKEALQWVHTNFSHLALHLVGKLNIKE